ncbi:TetR/AcrR family transcriptional regulator [Streptomyces sp. NPDC057580]|uniref:TetR/AcrR family transcriptional regulator n=1 Tax=Streptomyces sp. NPDC057580 TaxID=3346173 RepID=UPI0036CC861B
MATAQAGGGRRRRGAATSSARRSELLGIAAEMFATRGYAQTTVRDIADEAGILSGSLYHHFSSKEAILTELLQDFLGSLHQRFVTIVEEGDNPKAILDSLIRSSFAAINEVPHAVALYQKESSYLATVPEFKFVANTSRDIEQVWLGVLDAGRMSGIFRKDLDRDLVYRYIRDAIWASVHWYRPGGRLTHETMADQYIALLHDGLLKP